MIERYNFKRNFYKKKNEFKFFFESLILITNHSKVEKCNRILFT